MNCKTKKFLSLFLLTTIIGTSAISVASAKIGSCDEGYWEYGGGLWADVYSKYINWDSSWYSASVRNSNQEYDCDIQHDNSTYAKATIGWTWGTDYAYYNHN